MIDRIRSSRPARLRFTKGLIIFIVVAYLITAAALCFQAQKTQSLGHKMHQILLDQGQSQQIKNTKLPH